MIEKLFIFLTGALVDHRNVIIMFIVIDIFLCSKLKISDVVS